MNSISKQYHLDQNTLVLSLQRSNKFAIGAMYFFAIVTIAMPIIGTIASIVTGNGFHIGFIIGILFLVFFGFFWFLLTSCSTLESLWKRNTNFYT